MVFYATPDRVGMTQARPNSERGARIIDYSGDFRFNDTESYAGYAGRIGKDTPMPTQIFLTRLFTGLLNCIVINTLLILWVIQGVLPLVAFSAWLRCAARAG